MTARVTESSLGKRLGALLFAFAAAIVLMVVAAPQKAFAGETYTVTIGGHVYSENYVSGTSINVSDDDKIADIVDAIDDYANWVWFAYITNDGGGFITDEDPSIITPPYLIALHGEGRGVVDFECTWSPIYAVGPVVYVEDVEIVATLNRCTVTFDANKGEGNMDPQGVAKDSATQLNANTFTRTGYVFTGWNTAADGSGTSYDDQGSITTSVAVTLYAQWTPATYVVAFDANGGTGSMGNMVFTYDEEKALTPNAFTRGDYTFAGWNTAADGSGTSYADGASVKNLTDQDDSVVTLYAQWLGPIPAAGDDATGMVTLALSAAMLITMCLLAGVALRRRDSEF